MDIRTIMKIDQLIKRQATGSPAELGYKLGISERAAYKYLKYMKEDLNAPIIYSKISTNYKYAQDGEFNFKWKVIEN